VPGEPVPHPALAIRTGRSRCRTHATATPAALRAPRPLPEYPLMEYAAQAARRPCAPGENARQVGHHGGDSAIDRHACSARMIGQHDQHDREPRCDQCVLVRRAPTPAKERRGKSSVLLPAIANIVARMEQGSRVARPIDRLAKSGAFARRRSRIRSLQSGRRLIDRLSCTRSPVIPRKRVSVRRSLAILSLALWNTGRRQPGRMTACARVCLARRGGLLTRVGESFFGSENYLFLDPNQI